MRNLVHVAVGVICQGDKILISQRAPEAHQGGLWEFPGGKVEAYESPQQALVRELDEELGIEPTKISPLFCVEFAYSDKIVGLDIWLVESFEGSPTGREGQPWQWIDANQLHQRQFPEANQLIIDYLNQVF